VRSAGGQVRGEPDPVGQLGHAAGDLIPGVPGGA
jgi:hypothetical protein